MLQSSFHIKIPMRVLPKNLSACLLFFATCCLLVAGMRVPDLSRPHRPKPSQRAVVQSHAKGTQSLAHKALDLAPPQVSPAAAAVPVPFLLRPVETPAAPPATVSLLRASRAPPAPFS